MTQATTVHEDDEEEENANAADESNTDTGNEDNNKDSEEDVPVAVLQKQGKVQKTATKFYRMTW